jgi:ABC-type multidrug transport system ATPase subunit/ABC-type multidrug transport system permease subunit
VLVARDVEVSTTGGVAILGPVSLDVTPGSMVALMGTSGSGKSTLIRVLAGVALPSGGSATWLGVPTEAAVQAVGYVPQRESVHERLTTREALGYAAVLRLARGAPIEQRVGSVLGELGLSEQADTLIRNLSGGERRRAACGLELVGDPHLLLLDEPTSGLDAVLERRLMELFRSLADRGRAVLVVTHATASLDLCDEVVVLEKGRESYRGGPDGALSHLGASNGTHAAVRPRVGAGGGGHPGPPAAALAPQPATHVLDAVRALDPGSGVAAGASPLPPLAARPFGLELRMIASRYRRTLTRDVRTLALLLGQAPLIGFLIVLVFHPGALTQQTSSPTNAVEITFMLMTGSIWLGVASACREVVKERGLVEREFDVGVRLDAYILAKASVLFVLTFVQVALLTLVVMTLQPFGITTGASLQIFLLAVLTGWTSVAMGLAVSCIARTVDQAAGTVPLILMPQLLFAGALIPIAAMPRLVSALANLTYARWSYAGIGNAAGIDGRLNAFGGSSVLGFSPTFFSLRFGTAAAILLGFTVAELLVAVYFLRIRPAPDS